MGFVNIKKKKKQQHISISFCLYTAPVNKRGVLLLSQRLVADQRFDNRPKPTVFTQPQHYPCRSEKCKGDPNSTAFIIRYQYP